MKLPVILVSFVICMCSFFVFIIVKADSRIDNARYSGCVERYTLFNKLPIDEAENICKRIWRN